MLLQTLATFGFMLSFLQLTTPQRENPREWRNPGITPRKLRMRFQ
jgi:hypothetical protein